MGTASLAAGASLTTGASPGAWDTVRTSSRVTRPCGPVGGTRRRSIPMSRASLRVAGVARGFSWKYSVMRGALLVARGADAAAATGAATGVAVAVPRRRPMPGRSSLMSPTAVAAGPSDFAGAAAAAGAPAPGARSNTTSTEWTGTIAPTAPRVSRTFPVRGAVIVTVALSVMTSTMGWSSLITSPGVTSQFTTSPSVTPSPMSGSLNSQVAISTSLSPGAPAGYGARAASIRFRGCTGTACRSRSRGGAGPRGAGTPSR